MYAKFGEKEPFETCGPSLNDVSDDGPALYDAKLYAMTFVVLV